jgi:hypothetical protein
LDFGDVSAAFAGEEITLTDTYAYSFTSDAITISASTLNAMITDVAHSGDGADALTGAGAVAEADIDAEGFATSLNAMATGSAKATIALAITGNALGDIGEIENDTVFDDLVSEADVQASLVSAIVPDAVVSLAEDILRNLGLSSSDGSDGGRDPDAPFEVGDVLQFNMMVKNGDITLSVDGASSLTNAVEDIDLFNAPTAISTIGTPGITVNDGATINDTPTSNVYAKTHDRYATTTHSETGLVANATYRTEKLQSNGGVIVRCEINLN